MRNQTLLLLAIAFTTLLTTSCKKDKEAEEEDNTCTETRQVWLDGTAGDFEFVTSEPCGNLRLKEVNVSQQHQDYGGHLFYLNTTHQIVDSLNDVKGTFGISIGVKVLGEDVDTVINGTDTTYSITAGNICDNMKLGKHYSYLADALNNNANAILMFYTDKLGGVWRTFYTTTDSSFVVTSIDGTISQSPGGGTYYPYCAISFKYNTMLIKQGTADSVHVKGTGRLGFH